MSSDFFEMNHISKQQKDQIVDRLSQILNYEPKIGVFGNTGVGKSSLCNSLFGSDVCEVDDIESCTRNPQEVLMKMGEKNIRLIDVPGSGESIERDKEYGELYARLLPELDLVLWLIDGHSRGRTIDQMFYKNIVKPHLGNNKPFFFVVTHVDMIDPFREWDIENHEPSAAQIKNIGRRIDEVAKSFDIARSKVIPVSSTEKYNLSTLVDEFVRALPKEKQISTFVAVNDEYQTESTERYVKKSFFKVAKEVVTDVLGKAAEKLIEGVIGLIPGTGSVFKSVYKSVKSWFFKRW